MKMNTALTLMLILPFLANAYAGDGDSLGTSASGTPSVSVLKNRRMLVVTMMGDPDVVGDSALKILYHHFFKAATDSEKNSAISPRVRWSGASLHADKKNRIGRYALPVSRDFPVPVPDKKGACAVVEEWRYGLTAEILHTGDYDSEPASLEILKAYVVKRGFTIVGDLEEEYIQGRGTFYRGNPKNYATVLRFQIAAIQDDLGADAPITYRPR